MSSEVDAGSAKGGQAGVSEEPTDSTASGAPTAEELVSRVNSELLHAQLRAEVEAEFERELELQREREGNREWELDSGQEGRTRELERQLQQQEEQLRRLQERKHGKSAGGKGAATTSAAPTSSQAPTQAGNEAGGSGNGISAADEQYFFDEDLEGCPLRQLRARTGDPAPGGGADAGGKRAKGKSRPKSQPLAGGSGSNSNTAGTPTLPRIRTPGASTSTAAVGVPSGIKINYAGHTDRDSGGGNGKAHGGTGVRATSLPNIYAATSGATVSTGATTSATSSSKVCI